MIFLDDGLLRPLSSPLLSSNVLIFPFRRPLVRRRQSVRLRSPLAFDYLVLQNGFVIGRAIQEFVGVAWANTASFAIPPVPPGEMPEPVEVVPEADSEEQKDGSSLRPRSPRSAGGSAP